MSVGAGQSKRCQAIWPGLVLALSGGLAMLCPLEALRAQDAPKPQISVAPTVVAQPASQAELAITIGPPDIVPKKSFVSLRGLPPSVSLTEGHAIGPGSWAVPLVGLPALRVNVPAGISGRADVVISLIGMDGRLLAEAKTALVVGPAAMMPVQEKAVPSPQKAPAEPPPTRLAAPAPAAPGPPAASAPAARDSTVAPSRLPELSAEGRARAERLMARGEDYLAAGNIVAARDFFERAADAGLAAGALRLAATYDPAELQRLQAQGIAADRATARKWYERARELGAVEAVDRLARLGSN
jgi:hypothetical protein